MPWGGNPDIDEADAVRALVGDMDASNPLLEDRVYTMICANEARLYFRGAMAAHMLAGKYARDITTRVGDLWYEAKTRSGHFLDLARRLRIEGQRRAVCAPFAGGVTVTDVETRKDDTSVTQPAFEVGMMDYEPPDESGE